MWARWCLLPYAWGRLPFTLPAITEVKGAKRAITVSLLPPWPVPRCSVAARRCVGALVPMPRASYPPPSPSLPLLRACTAVAGATRHSGGPLLRGRAGAARLVHGAGRSSPCLPSQWLAAAVAGAPLLGGGSMLRGRASADASYILPAALHPACHCCELAPLSPVPQGTAAARCCAGALVPFAWCMMPAVLHPACHRSGLAAAVAGAPLLGGGSLLCGGASADASCILPVPPFTQLAIAASL